MLTTRSITACAVLAVAAFSLAGCSLPTPKTLSTPQASAATAPSSTPVVQDSPAPFSYEDAGFVPELKTNSKHCFGDYGCNYTVTVKLDAADPASIPEDASGSVTFQITGVEDGPLIDTIDISGGTYSPSSQSFTAGKDAKPKVTITEIETD